MGLRTFGGLGLGLGKTGVESGVEVVLDGCSVEAVDGGVLGGAHGKKAEISWC